VLFSLYNCTVIEENNMSNRLNFYDNIVSVGGRGYLFSSIIFIILHYRAESRKEGGHCENAPHFVKRKGTFF
jgi:hypothetical protein